MPGRTTTLILGIVFYVLGAIIVNVFLEPTQIGMFFHPAIELTLIAYASPEELPPNILPSFIP